MPYDSEIVHAIIIKQINFLFQAFGPFGGAESGPVAILKLSENEVVVVFGEVSVLFQRVELLFLDSQAYRQLYFTFMSIAMQIALKKWAAHELPIRYSVTA